MKEDPRPRHCRAGSLSFPLAQATRKDMRIYTRTGDQGTTGLFGGSRVDKDHPRIDAYGTVDETNAHLGLARALLRAEAGGEVLDPILHDLQGQLFELGADLATPPESRARHVPRVTPAHVEHLERLIDRFEDDLPPLQHFILPAGTPAAAALHVARTVCRRAERLTVAALRTEAVNDQAVVFLNRLSDLLFVLARWANHRSGYEDVPWHGRG
jgi:cob(I)alamin adenosyltransferase